ncbi:hypothetical protein Esti_000603 [Eimeria stiedai]
MNNSCRSGLLWSARQGAQEGAPEAHTVDSKGPPPLSLKRRKVSLPCKPPSEGLEKAVLVGLRLPRSSSKCGRSSSTSMYETRKLARDRLPSTRLRTMRLSGLAPAAARAVHVPTTAALPSAAAAPAAAAAGSEMTRESSLAAAAAAAAALPRGAQLARGMGGNERCFSSSSSSSSGSSSRQQPVRRRIRSRSYDPPLASDFAEADRLERMPRASQTTGSWTVSWAPFKPSVAAATAAGAAASEKSSKEAAAASLNAPSVGYAVPYRFRVEDNCIAEEKKAQRLHPLNRPSSSFLTYTDFAGNRLPILDTSENVRYWRDEGLDRLLPRVFPLRLPAHRRLDPLLRELIFSLFQFDPRRFSVSDLAMRYGLREKTVRKIIREFSVSEFLRTSKLATASTRRISKAEAVLNMKEIIFKQKLGYEQMGSEEIDSQEETKFEGWKSTFDWILRQHIEVETMSAFPLPGKRDPVPKRVDVDLTVKNTKNLKVISWIDPNEKGPPTELSLATLQQSNMSYLTLFGCWSLRLLDLRAFCESNLPRSSDSSNSSSTSCDQARWLQVPFEQIMRLATSCSHAVAGVFRFSCVLGKKHQQSIEAASDLRTTAAATTTTREATREAATAAAAATTAAGHIKAQFFFP